MHKSADIKNFGDKIDFIAAKIWTNKNAFMQRIKTQFS